MKTGWMKYALAALLLEKVVQHLFVTAAFYLDLGGIRFTVAVSPDALMILGALAAVLFALSLWGLLAGKRWALGLVIGLALFDLIGEFVAQGRLAINLNVSFLIAALILILALAFRRQKRASPVAGAL